MKLIQVFVIALGEIYQLASFILDGKVLILLYDSVISTEYIFITNKTDCWPLQDILIPKSLVNRTV